MAEHGLTRRLGRDLLRQAVLISVAVFISMFAAGLMIEDVLIEQALESEAEYYWNRVDGGGSEQLPDTQNLTGFRPGRGEGVPVGLAGYASIWLGRQDYSARPAPRPSGRHLVAFGRAPGAARRTWRASKHLLNTQKPKRPATADLLSFGAPKRITRRIPAPRPRRQAFQSCERHKRARTRTRRSRHPSSGVRCEDEGEGRQRWARMPPADRWRIRGVARDTKGVA